MKTRRRCWHHLLNFEPVEKVNKLINYPVKILISFGEAVSGDKKFLYWLMHNGYPELAALANSIHTNDDAFKWLMQHKYPHFAAFSKAVWDDENALKWLKKNKFDFLALLAEAVNEDENALRWLEENNLQVFVIISKKIYAFKQRRLDDLNDYHKGPYS